MYQTQTDSSQRHKTGSLGSLEAYVRHCMPARAPDPHCLITTLPHIHMDGHQCLEGHARTAAHNRHGPTSIWISKWEDLNWLSICYNCLFYSGNWLGWRAGNTKAADMGSIQKLYISQEQKFYLEHNELYNVLSRFQSFKLPKIKFAEQLVLLASV